ncbi:hypothetical protein [Moorena sp. SIO4G3]|uniref:hypothetical protein n=1 Tax=Moorena sp. SIO4G3 TaxID=2607821 RepID=UPI0025CF8D8B|nr:hypothetical protein [Moorena sp. SIO4G3]
MGETTAVAHGFGSVCGTCVRTCLDAKREWGKPPVPKLHRSPAPWKPPRPRCLPCSLAASLR